MKRALEALANERFDLLVIGGGITGACVAWDAALRGFSVALVEKGDFGGATSAASSKLVHGGIRYLQQGLLHKVRESVRERRIFLRIAPHLVHPVPFLVPTYGHGWRGPELLAAGLLAYDALTLDRNRGLPDPAKRVPRHRLLPARRVRALAPMVPTAGLTGGAVYHDAQMTSPERVTLAFVLGAAGEGAAVANYVEAESLRIDGGRVRAVAVRDLESGDRFEIRARAVANAAGPWALGARFAPADARRPRLAFAKGVHLVVPPLHDRVALALATREPNEAIVNRGGRHVFFIPWRGRTLVGTTNVPYRESSPDAVRPTERDVAGFLAELARACPAAGLEREDVQLAFAGLYPLVDVAVAEGRYQGSGAYRIRDGAAAGAAGLFLVLGAKFTTARRLAEKAVDAIAAKLSPRSRRRCTTPYRALPGGDCPDFDDFLARLRHRHGARLGPAAVDEMARHLGTCTDEVIGAARSEEDLRLLSPSRPVPLVWLRHSIEREMARRLEDLVFRRTGIGTIGHPGRAVLERCARVAAEELGWDEARVQAEIAACERRFRIEPEAAPPAADSSAA